MGLTVSILGEAEAVDQLQAFSVSLSDNLATQSGLLAQQIVQTIVDEKLSGQTLQARTGKLRDSVVSSVDAQDASVTGQIGVDGVAYAAIQEYGGTTKAHIIEATQAKALAFGFLGKQAFFRRIQHPGSVIPERSFLRAALDESTDLIVAGFRQALAQAASN